jgi:hypothetical protein
MRFFPGFCLLACIGCQSQSPESNVVAAYSQLEKAVQRGDADHTFVGLWSREKTPEAEKMRTLLHPSPNVHYTVSKVFVQGNEAVLLGQYAPGWFISLRYINEDGQWKIKDLASGDKPFPAESVFAMLPPPAGAFERAGEPWQKIPQALDNAGADRQGWQLRTTYDESFLYIRIESSAPIPPPGTPADKPPMGWPVMKIDVPALGSFVLHATANIGDRATFDHNGQANSHLHYVSYWLMLEHSDRMLFQSFAGLDPDPLIRAGGHSLEVRIPLKTMGIAHPAHAKFVIGDAQWPKSAIFTVGAQQYR